MSKLSNRVYSAPTGPCSGSKTTCTHAEYGVDYRVGGIKNHSVASTFVYEIFDGLTGTVKFKHRRIFNMTAGTYIKNFFKGIYLNILSKFTRRGSLVELAFYGMDFAHNHDEGAVSDEHNVITVANKGVACEDCKFVDKSVSVEGDIKMD